MKPIALLVLCAVLAGAPAAVAAESAEPRSVAPPKLVAPPKKVAPPRPLRPPANKAAEAEAYDRCLKLAQLDPAAGRDMAERWQDQGGAHPAAHCFAVALVGLKQYKQAATRLEALGQAMERSPASLRAEIFAQAGQAWLLAGDPGRAYAADAAALQIRPDDLELLVDRAEAAGSAGWFDKAVADLDQVLQTQPDRVDALVYRASANRALERLDAALADADKAVAQAPDSVPALLERGNIRRLKGDTAGARNDWVRVSQLAPGTPADRAAKSNIERLELKEGR
jgi:tetratricopeptide (TPR) repeat protein